MLLHNLFPNSITTVQVSKITRKGELIRCGEKMGTALITNPCSRNIGHVFCPMLVIKSIFLFKYGLIPTQRNIIMEIDIIDVITRISNVPLQLE